MRHLVISRRRLATAIALALVAASVLSVRLPHPPLHVDEVTYMRSTLDAMFQDSVFPLREDGEMFVNKPPLALWLIRLSFELLGPSSFAARLPSVLAAVATTVVLYLFGAAVFGEMTGILAALVFVLTPGILRLHGIRSATPDGLEILLVTSAIVLLELWRRHRRPWMLPCLVAMMATTAWVKSPFALLVFMTYLLATELPARRAGLGTPRLGAAVAGVIGAWIAAYLLWLGTLSAATSPRAVTDRLLVEQYARRIEGRLSKAHVRGPRFYLKSTVKDFGPLLLLPVGAALAAGITAGLASRRGWRPSRHDVACLVVWSLAAPVLATASVSKVHWYAYLSYPGIALLLGASAEILAQAVSDRRSVHAAFLAATVLVLLWRLPADRIWPSQAMYRSPAGRLWEVARREQIAVVPGPGFRALPLQKRNDDGRETWLFLQMLLWQSRDSSDPAQCRAMLVNRRSDASRPEEVLVIHRLKRSNRGFFLSVDGCGERLREVQ